MTKNATPRQLALFAALLISGFVLLLAVIATLSGFVQLALPGLIAVFAGVFLFSYGAISYTLKRFIYRKIKLIYKSIHKFKVDAQNKKTDIDMSEDIIGDVEKEVNEWADSQAKEIDDLRELEIYRRNFMGNISHELKTPIFNIQGYIHSLLDGGLEDPDINHKYLKKAANNVERLQTIVEDLDTISSLESGKYILDLQAFDIRKLATEVFEDLEIKAVKKGIQFGFKDGADNHFIVNGDRENIRQVLTNLVLNSVKYGQRGGHTTVSFYDMDKNVLIEIADNGIGISKEHIDRVFERFYRVDKSRSRAQGGSGLGLAIVKHIIEAHRQTIHVRSNEGKGSTFGFTLEKA